LLRNVNLLTWPDPNRLILTYRPGYSNPFGERTFYNRFSLKALEEKESLKKPFKLRLWSAENLMLDYWSESLIWKTGPAVSLANWWVSSSFAKQSSILSLHICLNMLWPMKWPITAFFTSQRKIIHAKIGELVEVLYSTRLGEYYDMLAYHFERGEVWEKAVEYLLQVAEKAKTRYASSSAVILCQRALQVAGKRK
jgi:hypothetical protein